MPPSSSVETALEKGLPIALEDFALTMWYTLIILYIFIQVSDLIYRYEFTVQMNAVRQLDC